MGESATSPDVRGRTSPTLTRLGGREKPEQRLRAQLCAPPFRTRQSRRSDLGEDHGHFESSAWGHHLGHVPVR